MGSDRQSEEAEVNAKARINIYDNALAAVQRHPNCVSDEDRQAIAAFLEHAGGNEDRIRYFESTVSMRAILHEDEDARKVTESLRAIIVALGGFVVGQPIPEELRPVIAQYIEYWRGLTYSENRMLDVLRSAAKSIPDDLRRRLREGD